MNTDIAENTGQLTDADLPKQVITPIAQEDIEKLLSDLRALHSAATGAGAYSIVLKDQGESIAITARLTTLGAFPERLEEFFVAKLKEEVGAFLQENGKAPSDAGGWPEAVEDEITASGEEVHLTRMGTADKLVAGVREQLNNAFGAVIYNFIVVSKGDAIKDIDHAESRFYVLGTVPFQIFDLFTKKAENCFVRLLTDADNSDTAADATHGG